MPKPSLRAAPVPLLPAPPTFAAALAAARRHLGLDQRALASALRVSLRTVSRWEHAGAYPTPAARPGVVSWARTLAPEVGEPVLLALGVLVVSSITAPAAGTTPPAAIDAALTALTEELDVGPRTVRRALDRFLAATTEAGATIADVRRRLAAADAKKR